MLGVPTARRASAIDSAGLHVRWCPLHVAGRECRNCVSADRATPPSLSKRDVSIECFICLLDVGEHHAAGVKGAAVVIAATAAATGQDTDRGHRGRPLQVHGCPRITVGTAVSSKGDGLDGWTYCPLWVSHLRADCGDSERARLSCYSTREAQLLPDRCTPDPRNRQGRR